MKGDGGIRAWQTIERAAGAARAITWVELDLALRPGASAPELRYVPFAAEDPTRLMASHAQFLSQFGVQAPEHRGVLVLRTGTAPSSFAARYPGLPPIDNDGATIVGADAAEVAVVSAGLRDGRLEVVRGRLAFAADRATGEPPRLLEAMLERLWYESRVLYFPRGKSDFRTQRPVPSQVDVVCPLSSRCGTLSANAAGHRAAVAFSGGHFVWHEEEYADDPFSSALQPAGLTIVDGVVTSAPIYARPALLLASRTHRRPADESAYGLGTLRPVIEHVGLANLAIRLPAGPVVSGAAVSSRLIVEAFGPGAEIVPATLNAPARSGGAAIYNRLHGAGNAARTVNVTPRAEGVLELVVVGRNVVALKPGGATFIPHNGFVVALPPHPWVSAVRDAVLAGAIEVELALDAGPRALGAISGCQAWTQLIAGGSARIDRDVADEYLPADPEADEPGIIPTQLVPESFSARDRAIIGFGTTPRHRCYVVMIEGAEPRSRHADTDSAGGGLRELADCLIRVGCDEAVALDSGGSATLAVNGRLAARPADRHDIALSPAERMLPGAWMAFTR